MKSLVAGLTLASLYFTFAASAMAQTTAPNEKRSTTETRQINGRTAACKQHKDAENIIRFEPTRDYPNFRDFLLAKLLNGDCVMMEKGTKVILSDRGVENETIAVRVEGNTAYLYVDQYVVQ
jgi:hypothetical protein